jgi:hypothetical protein
MLPKIYKDLFLQNVMVNKKDKKVMGASNEIKSISVNYWMVASVILTALLLIIGAISLTSGISKKTAEKEFLEFAQSQGADVEIKGIKSVGNLYEIAFDFEGQEGSFHITRDGKYIGQMISLKQDSSPATNNPNQQAASSYSVEDQAKLLEFNTCLAQAGVVLYGANWCGYTSSWVNTLGGYNSVSPIYVECTQNDELCLSEKVTSYPTTKINGQAYNSARTLEGIAKATGCMVPELTGTVSQASVEATC